MLAVAMVIAGAIAAPGQLSVPGDIGHVQIPGWKPKPICGSYFLGVRSAA